MTSTTSKKHSKIAAGLAFAIGVAAISTIAFAAIDHNSSRSNISRLFGGKLPITVVYDFKLDIKFKKKSRALNSKEMNAILSQIMKLAHKDLMKQEKRK